MIKKGKAIWMAKYLCVYEGNGRDMFNALQREYFLGHNTSNYDFQFLQRTFPWLDWRFQVILINNVEGLHYSYIYMHIFQTNMISLDFFMWIIHIEVRTIDSAIAGYGKGRVKCFLGKPQYVLDLVSKLNACVCVCFCFS